MPQQNEQNRAGPLKRAAALAVLVCTLTVTSQGTLRAEDRASGASTLPDRGALVLPAANAWIVPAARPATKGDCTQYLNALDSAYNRFWSLLFGGGGTYIEDLALIWTASAVGTAQTNLDACLAGAIA